MNTIGTTNTSLIDRAVRIAAVAHKEQVRKNDRSPYVVHVFMVGYYLQQYGFPEQVIAAGIVHDVLEDTDFPADQFRLLLGVEVCAIVDAVTNDSSLTWADKKKKYIESVRSGPEGSKAVCVVDKIHNAQTMLATEKDIGSDIWKKFSTGKEQKMQFERDVLAMLKETWSHPLIDEYESLIAQMDVIPEV